MLAPNMTIHPIVLRTMSNLEGKTPDSAVGKSDDLLFMCPSVNGDVVLFSEPSRIILHWKEARLSRCY